MDDKQLPPQKTSDETDDAKAVAEIEHQNGPVSGGQSKAPLAGSNDLRTREDYLAHYDEDRPKKKHRFLHFLGWMLLIAVLAGGIGGSVWYFWLRKQPKEAPQTSQTEQPAENTQKTEESDPTETYNSTPFSLQFDYPAAWKAADGPNNTIVVTSTPLKLKTTSKTQTGQVVMTVSHKQNSLLEFATGNALEVRESEKIDYKKPSQVQRASTYLSFLNYDKSTAKGIDGVYITGDFGYVKDQYVAQDDVIKADPLVAVKFRACKDDACAAAGDFVTLSTAAWDDTNFAKPIRTMLESIIVQ